MQQNHVHIWHLKSPTREWNGMDHPWEQNKTPSSHVRCIKQRSARVCTWPKVAKTFRRDQWDATSWTLGTFKQYSLSPSRRTWSLNLYFICCLPRVIYNFRNIVSGLEAGSCIQVGTCYAFERKWAKRLQRKNPHNWLRPCTAASCTWFIWDNICI